MGRGRSQKSVDLVEAAHDILEDIQPASVRAVCYQLFIRGQITGMDKANTNRVGALLTRAREEGEIPWEWIVQEGREIEGKASWKDPAAYAQAVQASYRRNKWMGQPKRIIVVSEKGTVRCTLAPVLDEYEAEFLAVGGYASATRVHELAQLVTTPDRKPVLLLYLGDHDPSGRGMSDMDLPRRLLRYASSNPSDKTWTDGDVAHYSAKWGLEVRRIALTLEDTEESWGTISRSRPAIRKPTPATTGSPRYTASGATRHPTARRGRPRPSSCARFPTDRCAARAAQRSSPRAVALPWRH